MAWIDPVSRSTGFDVTAAIWDQDVVTNPLVLRAGGIAIAGQAATRIPYASSATQLATAAGLAYDGTGLVLSGNGSYLADLVTATGAANLKMRRTGGTASSWELYLPAGSTDLRLFSGSDRLSLAATGALALTASAAGVNSISAINASATGYGAQFSGGGASTYAFSVSDYTGSPVLLRVSGTGNLSIGSANITDAVAVPTIQSGFGTSPSIIGKAFGFRVTVGTGGVAATGAVAFNATFATAPVCVASMATGAVQALEASSTTTSVSIVANAAWGAGDEINVLCRGF